MLNMTNQALCLVLRNHANAPDSRINAVGKREINDTELTPKGNRWFGAPVSQLM